MISIVSRKKAPADRGGFFADPDAEREHERIHRRERVNHAGANALCSLVSSTESAIDKLGSSMLHAPW